MTPYSDRNYPAIIRAIKAGLARLELSELPQDSVILCGSNISPAMVGHHLASAEVGQVQVYHGGVEHFDYAGDPEYLSPTTWDNEEQEKVGRSWVSGVGGSLVTHNNMFGGAEAGTSVFISRAAGVGF